MSVISRSNQTACADHGKPGGIFHYHGAKHIASCLTLTVFCDCIRIIWCSHKGCRWKYCRICQSHSIIIRSGTICDSFRLSDHPDAVSAGKTIVIILKIGFSVYLQYNRLPLPFVCFHDRFQRFGLCACSYLPKEASSLPPSLKLWLHGIFLIW